MDQKEYKIYNNDCNNIFKNINDKSIDLILKDPPYNIAKYSTGNINMKWRSEINNDIAEWDKIKLDPHKYVKEFKRILKPTGNIFIFTSYNQIGKWHEAFDSEFDTFQFMVWHKTNPAPKIFKSGFLNSCELIVCMWNKGHKWNFKSQNKMHNFIEGPICMGNERIKEPKHPSQKPIYVLKHIIEIASEKGDIIFDPFMGVGSTGIATLELNRKFIGCEIEKVYFEVAKKRLSHTQLTFI